jgi:putative Holliday junction resolvase
VSGIHPGGRVLGLDPGTKTIGVAVSDELRLAAHGLPNIAARPAAKAMEAIKGLVARYTIGSIVVGLPINMDGTLGPSAEAARDFARRLE